MPAERGDKIGTPLYALAGACALAGTLIAAHSILAHLRAYRRPDLQRHVLRVIWLVPIYAVSSFVSLSSQHAAEYIDIVRDLYEPFVLYSFFTLLVNCFGSEGELLARMEERPRTHHPYPMRLFLKPIDVSDPETFLKIKRGILQFVLVKPVLAVVIMLLKMGDWFSEGYIAWSSPYLWISLFYNLSVCVCMYSLVIVLITVQHDLRDWRPVPKFLCVKALLFFSFWQGFTISFLVKLGIIREKHEYSKDNMAAAYQDMLICIEMIPFALGHMYAFSENDYESTTTRFQARLPLADAIRDAFGVNDIIQDSLHTLRGTAFRSYHDINPENERGMEDGETNFVLDKNRSRYVHRKLRRMGSSAAAQSTDDLAENDKTDLEFSDVGEEEDSYYARGRELRFGDYRFPSVVDMKTEMEIQARNRAALEKREKQNELAKGGSSGGDQGDDELEDEDAERSPGSVGSHEGLLGGTSSK